MTIVHVILGRCEKFIDTDDYLEKWCQDCNTGFIIKKSFDHENIEQCYECADGKHRANRYITTSVCFFCNNRDGEPYTFLNSDEQCNYHEEPIEDVFTVRRREVIDTYTPSLFDRLFRGKEPEVYRDLVTKKHRKDSCVGLGTNLRSK